MTKKHKQSKLNSDQFWGEEPNDPTHSRCTCERAFILASVSLSRANSSVDELARARRFVRARSSSSSFGASHGSDTPVHYILFAFTSFPFPRQASGVWRTLRRFLIFESSATQTVQPQIYKGNRKTQFWSSKVPSSWLYLSLYAWNLSSAIRNQVYLLCYYLQ